MSKARKKFLLASMIALFVLLTVLLAIINVINLSKAAEDADMITKIIAEGKGSLRERREAPPETGGERPGANDRMRPDSPEMPFSSRYFTFKFDKEGNAKKVDFNVSESSFTEEEAEALARSLKDGGETGWTNTTYRFRVYRDHGDVYVTVLDQGRELGPSYRILIISVVGEAIGLAVCFAFLLFASRAIFKPLEDADRKQKKFLAEAECEFKIPLTVINTNAEIIERESGSTDETRSIRRQVRKMTSLTKKIGALAIYEGDGEALGCDLSEALVIAIDSEEKLFGSRGISVTADIQPRVIVRGDPEALRGAVKEIVRNAAKFALTHAAFTLKSDGDRVTIASTNDSSLPDGAFDEVFDRFTRLSNAADVDGNGLGLSYVKDAFRTCNGRLSAAVEGGEFIIRGAI